MIISMQKRIISFQKTKSVGNKQHHTFRQGNQGIHTINLFFIPKQLNIMREFNEQKKGLIFNGTERKNIHSGKMRRPGKI